MNFTTDLPKRNPLVSYIVASAVRCEKFFPASNKPGPVYRMHAVILKENGIKLPINPQEDGENRQRFELFICCHLRRVESGEGDGDGGNEEEIPQLKEEQKFNNKVDSSVFLQA